MARPGVWRWVISRVLALLVGLAVSPSARAESLKEAGVEFGPAPAWVLAPSDDAREPESSSGIALSVADADARFVKGEAWKFRRSVMKVTSEAGTRVAGELKFAFVPPFERIVFHKLEVRRAGATTSQLDPKRIQVLRREARLESSIYDGARTAVALVPDVQVGDVVVSEISVVGANPVLGGHVGDYWEQQLVLNVGAVRYRITTDRALDVSVHGGATEPEHRESGGLHEYVWSARDLRAMRPEEHSPPESDLVPWVAFTDYRSWAEVVAWGRKLFELPEKPTPRVKKALDELAGKDAESRALAALRLVQERVRYLSLAFAESSHKPAHPEQVLERGFGDCKDKSLLLLALLRGSGIEADPALVTSSGGSRLPRLRPTTFAFDHVVVAATIDGRKYWLDPTRTHQRGRLDDVSVTTLTHALVLAQGAASITAIERPDDARADVHASATFDVKAFGGPTLFSMTTRYTRRYADGIRALRAATSQQEFNEKMRQAMLAMYSKARAVGDATVADDETRNEVVVAQEFELRDEWTSGTTGQPTLSILPPWFTARLYTVAADREAPLALEYPLLVTAKTDVRLPGPIRLEPSDAIIREGGLSFQSRRWLTGSLLSVEQRLETLVPVVEKDVLPAHRRAATAALKTLDFAIVKGVAPVGTWRGVPLVSALVWFLVLLGSIVVVQRKQPYLPMRDIPYDAGLSGIGSWLVLVALGVTIGPFLLFFQWARHSNVYAAEPWRAVTGVEPLWGFILTFELVCNLTLVVGYAYTAYLFWSRRRTFPLAFISMLVFSVVFNAVDFVLVDDLVVKSEQGRTASDFELMRSIVVGVIWSAYMLRSKRVRSTFLPAPSA